MTTSLPPSRVCRCGLPKFPHEIACWVCKETDVTKTFDSLTAAVAESQKPFKTRVAEVLKAVEWVSGGCDGGDSVCASCDGINNNYDCFGDKVKFRGHKPDCALAALLKECES